MIALFKSQTERLKSAWQAAFGRKTLNGLPEAESQPELRETAITLICGIGYCSGDPNRKILDEFKTLLSSSFSAPEIERFIEHASKLGPEEISESARKLKDVSAENQHKLVSGMISLAYADENYDDAEREYVNRVARELGVKQEDVDHLAVQFISDKQKKEKLIKSGTGIVAALVVLGVFILTATWLLSLLIGLILAYIFLPLEKWYERHLSKGGWLYFISRTLGNMSSSFDKITSKPELSEDELKHKAREQLISRATTATLATVTILALIISTVIVSVSYRYVSGGIRSAYEATTTHQENVLKEDKEATFIETMPYSETVKGWIAKLEAQKARVENLPIIRDAIEIATMALKDEQTQKEIFSAILKRTGGVVSMTAGVLYNIVMFLLNVLLTFFFFSLLLRKMAENVSNHGDTAEQQSGYIVKTVMQNDWMPHMDEKSMNEARTIISEVINRLKLWLRGYLTLVLIDSTVYSIVFTILRVPYSMVFGILAGMGVLLPYIGPVASACLTVLACLVIGSSTHVMFQILLVICAYSIYNGVIEQFILYPRVIGDRLGLTTLETIIVVLLGALFAGIFGMIFALPTASVLKYLLQQVYAALKPEPKALPKLDGGPAA